MTLRRFLILALLVGSVGCVKLAQPAPKIGAYRLAYTSPTPTSTAAALPVTLRIPPFAVDTIYDREPIVYREDPYSTGIYHYHHWSSPPGSMVADLIARDLAAAGLYRAVLQEASMITPDYQLDGYVEEIEERGKAPDCTAALRLRITLVRVRQTKGDPIVWQATYASDVPSACNDPRALAAAMSQNLERISTQLQHEIHDAMTHDRGSGE
jgi:ABC-type uncharacterized transport system auxiliary subunit